METIRTRQLEQENDCLRKSLSLALDRLFKFEPPDSRAVSDEFVAMASVQGGDTSLRVMTIIDRALMIIADDAQASCMCGAGDEPCPGSDGKPLCV